MSTSEINAVVRMIGQTNDVINKLFLEVKALGGGMKHLLRIANDPDLRRKLAKLIMAASAHVVDTNTLLLPEGYAEERHVLRGNVTLDPAKLRLSLEPEQSNGGCLVGTEMSKRLTGRPDVLGLCELQYLYYGHQELIPESWKEVWGVCGWNTILRGPRGNLYVPYLRWFGGGWCLRFRELDIDWNRKNPAGLLASE